MSAVPFADLSLCALDGFLAGVRDLTVPGGEPEGGLEPLAGWFAAQPLAPGSAVIISLANGRKLLRFFFAALAAGYVPVLVPPSLPSARARQTAARIGAGALVRLRIGDYRGTAAAPVGGAEVMIFSGHRHQRHEPGHVLLMTSGTSGSATGCLHRVDALLRNAARHAASIGLRSGDTVGVNLPIYYSFALVAQVLGSLVTGARLVIDGPPFTVGRYAESMLGEQVTVSSLTPILVRSIVAAGGALPRPLRTLTVGGQRLAPDLVARLLDRNPGTSLYLTYGLTEAGPRVSTLAAHAEPPRRYGSAGRPILSGRTPCVASGSAPWTAPRGEH
jgi:acyl-CoA synthetase (AMP-forming)/AMP-acid ligase II